MKFKRENESNHFRSDYNKIKKVLFVELLTRYAQSVVIFVNNNYSVVTRRLTINAHDLL